MFANEIMAAHRGSTKQLILDLSIGYIRFLDANPKFRAVIFFCDENGIRRSPLTPSKCAMGVIGRYAEEVGLDEKEKARRIFVVYSIILGATLIPREGMSLSEEQLDMVRESIKLVIES